MFEQTLLDNFFGIEQILPELMDNLKDKSFKLFNYIGNVNI